MAVLLSNHSFNIYKLTVPCNSPFPTYIILARKIPLVNNGHADSITNILVSVFALLTPPQHAKYYMPDSNVTFKNVSEKLILNMEQVKSW